MCDGTRWSVEILTGGISVKYGNNVFPEEWGLFCNSIRRIMNRKFQDEVLNKGGS